MAVNGPPPKDPSKRHPRAKPGKFDADKRVVVMRPNDPNRKPVRELPRDLLPADKDWHPATLRWWNTWAASELMADLPETDWMELEATARIHHEFMTSGKFTLAGELRSRMAKFGATPEDRMKLRISIVSAEEAERKANKPAPSSSAKARDRHQGFGKKTG